MERRPINRGRPDLRAGAIETEVFGVRTPPHREQHVRAHHHRVAGLAIDPHGDTLLVMPERDAVGVHANGDALALEDARDRRRDLLVLTRDEAGTHLDDGDLAAEPPVHLGELETDVAPADGRPAEVRTGLRR